jgi:hypothetical protein
VSDLEGAFERLLGYQPSDQERQRLYRVRDALRLKTTDALWLLMIALQHYETIYEKIPARIAEEASRTMNATRLTAEAQARAAQEQTRQALMKTVEQAAVASRRDGARAEVIRRASWHGGGLVAVGLTVFLIGFRLGGSKGEAAGRDRARQECGYLATAAAWGNSPEGALAREMAAVGSLEDVARCDMPGWEVTKDGYCLVRAHKGKTFGWRLPANGHWRDRF